MKTAAGDGTRYGMGRSVALPYEQAIERTRDALQREGFGILTEIDVKGTLKKKLDVDFRKYVILGAATLRSPIRGSRPRPTSGCCCPAM